MLNNARMTTITSSRCQGARSPHPSKKPTIYRPSRASVKTQESRCCPAMMRKYLVRVECCARSWSETYVSKSGYLDIDPLRTIQNALRCAAAGDQVVGDDYDGDDQQQVEQPANR